MKLINLELNYLSWYYVGLLRGCVNICQLDQVIKVVCYKSKPFGLFCFHVFFF